MPLQELLRRLPVSLELGAVAVVFAILIAVLAVLLTACATGGPAASGSHQRCAEDAPGETMRPLIERYPQIRANIMQALADHMNEALLRVRELTTARAPQRIAVRR